MLPTKVKFDWPLAKLVWKWPMTNCYFGFSGVRGLLFHNFQSSSSVVIPCTPCVVWRSVSSRCSPSCGCDVSPGCPSCWSPSSGSFSLSASHVATMTTCTVDDVSILATVMAGILQPSLSLIPVFMADYLPTQVPSASCFAFSFPNMYCLTEVLHTYQPSLIQCSTLCFPE